MRDQLAKELYLTLVANKLIPEWAQEDSENYLAAFEHVLKDYLIEKKN